MFWNNLLGRIDLETAVLFETGKDIHGLNNQSLDLFMSYGWPGNVRELKGAQGYAFVIAEQGLITPDQLPPQIKGTVPHGKGGSGHGRGASPVEEALSEKETLIRALEQTKGNQTRAAKTPGGEPGHGLQPDEEIRHSTDQDHDRLIRLIFRKGGEVETRTCPFS